jgi:hypothetical protein
MRRAIQMVRKKYQFITRIPDLRIVTEEYLALLRAKKAAMEAELAELQRNDPGMCVGD